MSKKDASNQSSAQTIIPLRVPIKSRALDQSRLQRRHLLGIILLVCSVVILIAVGAGLLHYLAKNPLQPHPVTDKQSARGPEPAPEKISQPPAPLPAAVDPEKLALAKQAAEQKLAEFLEIKKLLDGKGAAEWGGKSYAEMIDIGRQADSLLIKKADLPAAAEYARAALIGLQIADQADAALGRMLEEGRIALTEGKGTVAQKKFSVALKIDPANQSAQKGFKRSQTIETVMQRIESGKQHEKDNALTLARTQYQQALEIDPDADEARRSLNRVTDLIKAQQFSQLMSAGLTALDNNDYALAQTRLLKAKSLRPDSREVSDALMQVDQALRLTRIDRLHDTAKNAEQSEDWQAALKSYLDVLGIDPNLQFAVRGKERAGEQIRIAKRLDYYLTQPQVLESDQQLENAVQLLDEAQQVAPRGQALASRINELDRLVMVAQTPVTITIESDNLTQIAVYKVGKLGRFSQHELKLRPGTYTVVGARDGYRDVRRKIVVKAGQQALRINVQCRVKI